MQAGKANGQSGTCGGIEVKITRVYKLVSNVHKGDRLVGPGSRGDNEGLACGGGLPGSLTRLGRGNRNLAHLQGIYLVSIGRISREGNHGGVIAIEGKGGQARICTYSQVADCPACLSEIGWKVRI